jgi:Mn-dependent DtxR family transcriptional regulator
MASAAKTDVRATLDRFLLAAYDHAEDTSHASPIATDDLAERLSISPDFAEKIATFLESEGLLDYDNQAVDITIQGMLRAESLLNPPPTKPPPAPAA